MIIVVEQTQTTRIDFLISVIKGTRWRTRKIVTCLFTIAIIMIININNYRRC